MVKSKPLTWWLEESFRDALEREKPRMDGDIRQQYERIIKGEDMKINTYAKTNGEFGGEAEALSADAHQEKPKTPAGYMSIARMKAIRNAHTKEIRAKDRHIARLERQIGDTGPDAHNATGRRVLQHLATFLVQESAKLDGEHGSGE